MVTFKIMTKSLEPPIALSLQEWIQLHDEWLKAIMHAAVEDLNLPGIPSIEQYHK